VAVRFRDLDPMGHAHHTLPIIYIEEARAAFWRDVAGTRLEDIEYVMADVHVRFLRRIFFPARLDVSLWVTELGRSRFVLEYAIRDEAGELMATARTTQVMYDYAEAASRPISASVRARLEAYMIAGDAQKSVASSAEPSPMKAPST
jgi:acyl-CoA thioester hydrolase